MELMELMELMTPDGNGDLFIGYMIDYIILQGYDVNIMR